VCDTLSLIIYFREKQIQKKLELQEQLRLDTEEIRRRKKEEEEAHKLHQEKVKQQMTRKKTFLLFFCIMGSRNLVCCSFASWGAET
jgi:hypothetical protein